MRFLVAMLQSSAALAPTLAALRAGGRDSLASLAAPRPYASDRHPAGLAPTAAVDVVQALAPTAAVARY